MDRFFANRGIGATLCRRWRRDEPRPRPAGWTEAQARGPSGRSTGQEHDAQARPPRLRPARARPRRARRACPRRPGRRSAGPRRRELGLHRRDVGRERDVPARRRHAASRAWRVGADRPRPAPVVGRRPRVDAVAQQPREPAVPERRRRPVPRQLRRDLRRAAGAPSRAPAPHPPRAVARRRGGRPRRRRGRRRARLPGAGRHHRGRHDRRRLQPRLSGLRRPAAHAHRHGLRAQPLARGPLVAAAGPRAARQRRRRLGLQLPVGRRHLRRGLLGRHAVALRGHAHRGRRVAARAAPDDRRGRRPHAVA